MNTPNELREQRAQLISEARSILENKDNLDDMGNMKADSQERWDTAMKEVDSLKAKIDTEERKEKQSKLETELKVSTKETRVGNRTFAASPANEIRAFNTWVRKQCRGKFSAEDLAVSEQYFNPYSPELKLNLGETRTSILAGSNQGTLIPTIVLERVEFYLKYFSALRDVATVMRTETGDTYNIPTMDFTGDTPGITAEAASITEVDPTINKVALSAYKFARLISVSTEMLTDNIFGDGLVEWISKGIGQVIGRGQSVYLENGTGSSQPTGLCYFATNSGTQSGSAVSTLTYDNVRNLRFAVDRAYQNDPSFAYCMSNSTLAAVMTLKDSSGRYLVNSYLESIGGKVEERLDGKPIVVLSSIKDFASSGHNTFMVAAPMKEFFIRDVKALELSVNPYENMSHGLINIYGTLRTDSAYVGPGRSIAFLTT